MAKAKIKVLGAGILSVIIMTAVVGISFLPQAAEGSHGDDVNVRLKWLHQAQFAGYYTAEQKGFYHDNGIDITLNPGGIDFPAIQMIAGGAEDFGVIGGDQILLAREKEVPIVAIAVIYRESPYVYFALKSSGITEPKDLIGKNVGVIPGAHEELMFRAMMKGAGVDTSLINEVNVRFDITPLLTGELDAFPGYAINQPITAEEKGFPVNLLWPSDYGVNPYADTLFTTEDMIKNNPDLVKRFVSATMQGWDYAYNNVDEVVGYTLMYSDVLTREHETSMMKASLKSLKPTDRPIGPMDRAVWEDMQKLLLDNGFMDNAIDLDKAFTNKFLPTAQAAEVSTLERKAALVMESSTDDIGWGTLHYNGMLALEEKLGYEIAISEKQDPPQWETAARDYAERGYKYVIMGGPQFTGVTAKIAPEYPETTFIVTAAIPPFDAPYPSNMVGLDAKNEQSGYLAGVLAAGMTKTNKVGIVAAFDYPNLVRMYEAFKLGVQTENPQVEIMQVYIGSFNDVSKGYEAAKGQIDAGADIIFQDLDRAAFGVINGINENPGVLHFGNTNDQVFLDQEITPTSALLNHTSLIVRGVEGLDSGKIKSGEFYRWGIDEAVTGLAPYHEFENQIPSALKAKIEELKNQMIEGTFVVPEIYDADGYKEYLAAAEVVEPAAEGGGCLIATAAFGSEMAPQVQLLREIRDNTILQTESGSAFMTGFNQFYYSFSPAIADYERENPAFKETVKLTLTPLLASLTLLQYADIDSESEMLGYGISVILLNIGMYFVAPTVLVMAVRKKISNKT